MSSFFSLILFKKFSNKIGLLVVQSSFHMLAHFIVQYSYAYSHTFKHIAQRAIKRTCQGRVILNLWSEGCNEDVVYLHVNHSIFVIYFCKMTS